MADNAKSKSIFGSVMTLFITLILFTTIGAYVFDLATTGSTGITRATSSWAEKAAHQLLNTIKTTEGL